MTTPIALTIALGAKPWRAALSGPGAAAKTFSLSFADVSPIHRAFAPMVREQRFDLSELAVVTAVQAFAAGKPVVLLPVVLASRFQHRCLITRRDAPATLDTLAGRRIGVRAYSQTTGMWIRGILQNDHGVDPASIGWVTQEGAHVAECDDPPWVERTAAGRKLVDLLRDGEVDAAILGNDLPDDPAFVSVFPEPEAAARAWYARHAVLPINHVMVVSRAVAERDPAVLRDVWSLLKAVRPAPAASGPDMTPIGIDAIRPGVETVLRFCRQQSLLARDVTVDALFAEAAALLGAAAVR
ncbi:phosphate ABC transporter substrate-binding protein [Rhodoplanes sp. TEM]|uniref:Phosphate ABC transporter substrate-binding protein n=1 Tax=Rhodoplanes tepidamans TaxID=200616 RepID=A0ABT5JGK7_RHOTP|nr:MULTISPECIES: phosphate ABC transporter substrate-binding protein [Rhodoplanes]MDC7788848.1 phosphate ABC transporter substrate-binding protein [Rhodoplanes tepidamans]MDC7986487.1 phosphate ABC transporter substrate-binding protein [Rhodoplanes sp. TEM]MDQ0357480.1 4,5-dihydroxyphthalate decarboxylase [Rhodoplanes tepidamans]